MNDGRDDLALAQLFRRADAAEQAAGTPDFTVRVMGRVRRREGRRKMLESLAFLLVGAGSFGFAAIVWRWIAAATRAADRVGDALGLNAPLTTGLHALGATGLPIAAPRAAELGLVGHTLAQAPAYWLIVALAALLAAGVAVYRWAVDR